MSRLVLVVSCASAALALVGGIALAASGDDASTERPTRGQLYRLQERIDKRSDALARQGIYVESMGQPAELCVAIDLANPTRPNIEFLHRQFGPDLCVSRVPFGQVQACTAHSRVRLRSGSVRVPDLSDLGLYEAARRALASDLTYAEGCLGARKRSVKRPTRDSPRQLVRVTQQCPRAGQLVPPGTEVAFEAVAVLPGGFEYKVSALTPYNTGTSRPCSDGRNAAPPEPLDTSADLP